MFLLDTNVCIRILNRSSEKLVARLREIAPSTVSLSSVTKAELLYGARHSGRPAENLRLLAQFFAPSCRCRSTISVRNTTVRFVPTLPAVASTVVPMIDT